MQPFLLSLKMNNCEKITEIINAIPTQVKDIPKLRTQLQKYITLLGEIEKENIIDTADLNNSLANTENNINNAASSSGKTKKTFFDEGSKRLLDNLIELKKLLKCSSHL